MRKEIIEVREGYGIERHYFDADETFPGSPAWDIVCTVNPQGQYIGTIEDAKFLVDERGIAPEYRAAESTVCSIGFCQKEQRWYGWSHRALAGFGIGDSISAGDCAAESLPIGFTAQTLDDARKMAEAFAQSVS